MTLDSDSIGLPASTTGSRTCCRVGAVPRDIGQATRGQGFPQVLVRGVRADERRGRAQVGAPPTVPVGRLEDQPFAATLETPGRSRWAPASFERHDPGLVVLQPAQPAFLHLLAHVDFFAFKVDVSHSAPTPRPCEGRPGRPREH